MVRKQDPVRPELDNEFRTSYGRKIYGVKYKNEIHAIMCFAFTNEIPRNVDHTANQATLHLKKNPTEKARVKKVVRQVINQDIL